MITGCVNNSGFKVMGSITTNNSVIENGIIYLFNKDMSISDTAAIVKGKFIFKGKISDPYPPQQRHVSRVNLCL